MGIWDRLETVVKSYFNDNAAWRSQGSFYSQHKDPDLDAAFEELNDFLKGEDKARSGKTMNAGKTEAKRPVPAQIRQDFEELGLTPEATPEECKEAYKKLLKIHHPDRHANHEGNMKKATDKTTRVNASYERLTNWFKINHCP